MAYEPANAQGEWIKLGSPWSTSHIGFWTKEVVLDNGIKLKVYFNVSPSLPTSNSDYKNRIGITHWTAKPRDKTYDESYLLVGAKRIQNIGADHIFVSLGPNSVSYDPDYFKDHPASSLTEMVQSDPYKKLFALPFKTFLLATYSFASRTWTASKPRPPFTPEMARREKEEFQQLTQYLIRTYQGTGKTFILKNWEGDWGLVDSGGDDPISIPTQYQIENHIAYQRARRQGVVEGRGSSRMVLDALEFWRVQRPQQNVPSYLRDVIPQVESDFISLSAWEVIPPPTADLRRRIIDDITFIRRYPGVGNRPLIVAEYGFDAHPDNADRAQIATQAFLDGGAFQAYYWLLESNGTGLIGLDGSRTDTWHQFRTLLGATNDSQVISSRLIGAVVPHQTSSFSIQLKNKGTTPWNTANGYHLAPLNEHHAAAWGLGTITLSGPDESVEPGAIKTFTIQATTPENPERYPLEWQMQQEHVGAFGERLQRVGFDGHSWSFQAGIGCFAGSAPARGGSFAASPPMGFNSSKARTSSCVIQAGDPPEPSARAKYSP
jgi:hypothetical protein